ncbi:aldo/keto reductase [Candidatus Pelagibacter sp.]|jgi:aryl-alcohol dehydrogenase-like predicted oxidoreductase|nr:aldo/keto reductase [Candidatus Pelagibacter sp.]
MQYFNYNNNKYSKICLGTWSLSGSKSNVKSYDKLSEKKIYNLLDEAVSNGINFFDTAPVYGDSEKFLGKFIRNFREKIFIASKVGCKSFNQKLNFEKKFISNQVNKILSNLNSDYIDIIQLYNPDPSDGKIFQAIEELENLKNKKKIINIGVSLNRPDDYLKIRKIYKFNFVQCNFNVLDQRLIDYDIFRLIKKDRVRLMGRTILNFGIFTEDFIKKKKINFSKHDHRIMWNKEQINRWKYYANKIKKISNRKIETTCYRFGNSFNLSGLIVGATKPQHLKQSLEKKNYLKINDNELKKIRHIYKLFNSTLLDRPNYKIKT